MSRPITDPALRSAAWAVVRDAIERDPVPWAATLGVTACGRQAKAMKSMADIFTGKGKGPQKEREPSNPKGFEAGVADRSLCSVGFGSEMTPCLADVTAQIELNDALVSSWVSTESATVGDELATADQAVDGWAPVDPEFRANVFERSGCIGERGESTRTRDSQRLAISWCVERGEFVDLPAEPQRPSRAAAESWVSTQLARAS